MPNYVKVSEYAQIKGINKKTVYRWVENGSIDAQEINGVLHVKLDDDSDNSNDTDVTFATIRQQNCHLQEVIDRLQTQLSQTHEIIEEMQQASQRSDTIILQLTKQLEQRTLLIEDMRYRSIWARFKTALGFASA